MVYQTEGDAVHLFVYDPAYANRSRTLIIQLNGNEHSRHTITLGSAGQAETIIRDLPAGQYSAFFYDESIAERHCNFTVADYKLASLSASFVYTKIARR